MNMCRQNDQDNLHDFHLWSNRIACMLHMIYAQILRFQITLHYSIVQDQQKILKESTNALLMYFSREKLVLKLPATSMLSTTKTFSFEKVSEK